MAGEFKRQQAERLCEDLAVLIHRYVCRIRWRPGFEDPLLLIARKADIPVKQLRMIYYGRRPTTFIEEIGQIQWACEEVLKRAMELD